MGNEQLFVKDVISQENTQSFKDFMQEFSGLEYQKSFANFTTTKHPMHRNGLISTFDLFNDLASSGEQIDNIPEFLEEYGQFEILEDKYDNTYNYSGYLDEYVNFSTYELENDQMLVTLAIGLGLDPRGGYTDNVAIVFDDEYTFLETLDETFQLMDFEVTVSGKKYLASFDATALSEYGSLNLDDKETGENVYWGEVVIDATDEDDLIENVSEIVGVDADDVEIDNINYFWYGSLQDQPLGVKMFRKIFKPP